MTSDNRSQPVVTASDSGEPAQRLRDWSQISGVLSDRDIARAMAEGKIKITPKPSKRQFGSCSIDLRLGSTFRIFKHSKHSYIDLRGKIPIDDMTEVIMVQRREPFIMQPGQFVLASTIEQIELSDDLMGRLEGRSSIGRLGIIIHSTASVFDPGWVGTATMELGNLGLMPVALYPGTRICSFTFHKLSSKAEVPYRLKPGRKYWGQQGPAASQIAGELAEDELMAGQQLSLDLAKEDKSSEGR